MGLIDQDSLLLYFEIVTLILIVCKLYNIIISLILLLNVYVV